MPKMREGKRLLDPAVRNEKHGGRECGFNPHDARENVVLETRSQSLNRSRKLCYGALYLATTTMKTTMMKIPVDSDVGKTRACTW